MELNIMLAYLKNYHNWINLTSEWQLFNLYIVDRGIIVNYGNGLFFLKHAH